MKHNIGKILMIVVGSAVFSLGFDLFLVPNGINCGGVSGIAMLINQVADAKWASVGVLTVLINVPLFILGYRKIGKYFFFSSLLGMAVTSVCFDLFEAILPVPKSEPLVAAIFGGVIIGAGIGVVFLTGASTGGGDIVARVMKLRMRNLPIGRLMLCLDVSIAIVTGIVYRDFNNTLYSIITLVVSCTVLDRVVYGIDYAKVAVIVSDKHAQVADAIAEKLDRGVTLLDGEGYYSRTDKTVLLTAIKRKQLAQLKEIVMTVDPNAFLILQDAQQVLGDGFKTYDRYEL
ncbi:MAG: YitT family protein [Oscillospiraceae bacterium]|nr:YitT family protein [Oscillospiraceae bacterium]